MEQTQFWLNEGTVVGERYRLESVLGKGGYGITYRGTDTRLNQSVAIKEYYPVFWSSRYVEKGNRITVHQGMESQYCKGLDRFLEEARTLAQLSGIAGVVRVTDFFEENATAYLVMEFLDGKNLKEVLESFGGRIPPQVLLPVLSPAIFALKRIHETGLIHRDLSPDNIMMLSDGTVRLIDFGNARDTTDNKSMTMAMKEGFAAPEQYRSKGQGTYTDVYGMCATIYYCLTGKLVPQAMERLMGAELVSPSQLGVDLPAWQEDVILRGLDLFVQNRIQTMDELWQLLYNRPEEPQDREPEYTVPQEKADFREDVVWYMPGDVQAQPPEQTDEYAHHAMEGMTVPLIRTEEESAPEEPVFQPEGYVPPLPELQPEEAVPAAEPEFPKTQEQPAWIPQQPQPRERYFVPPKPVEAPPQQERSYSLVQRMQALCARIFGKG